MGALQDLLAYYNANSSYLWLQFLRHFLISLYGVFFAALISIPAGFAIARRAKMASWLISIANVIQTVPSLAMLSILMLGFGLGPTTVVVTVFLYSILPILKNTYTGVRNIDAGLIDTAKGMGMNPWQVRLKVELPLSLSVIMGGVRNALVLAIGITAIGTFIGAGGLGDIISRGINVADGGAIILAGAVPCAVMAIVADLGLGVLERRLDPLARHKKVSKSA
ncbi:ABC transporter permease [Peptococcus simiae]|uniref:ABC transporter permease n=1 Tax=Peptococcus simiae TaxID=1643805 RepID=A0ABW9H1Y9_9FIRM